MPRLPAATSPAPAPASESAAGEDGGAAAAAPIEGATNATTIPSSNTCPTGGSGGPRCCARCSTSYVQILANQTKASETAAIAAIGQEVSQLQEMLRDAQTRLRRAVDVSKENDVRREAV